MFVSRVPFKNHSAHSVQKPTPPPCLTFCSRVLRACRKEKGINVGKRYTPFWKKKGDKTDAGGSAEQEEAERTSISKLATKFMPIVRVWQKHRRLRKVRGEVAVGKLEKRFRGIWNFVERITAQNECGIFKVNILSVLLILRLCLFLG